MYNLMKNTQLKIKHQHGTMDHSWVMSKRQPYIFDQIYQTLSFLSICK